MKRALRMTHNDGTASKEMEIGKAAVVKSDSEFIYFEKMNDGKWRLTFSESVVGDFPSITSFDMVR